MNKRIIIYLFIVGLVSFLTSCEKDETKAVLSSSPVAPTIKTLPALTLERDNSSNVLVFKGTPVNPGFQASANYYLEACEHGNEFQNSIVLLSGIQDTLWQISVGELNTILLRKFTADATTSMDFRIRSVLVAGNGINNLVYNSPIQTVDVTIYGFPRLDLINNSAVIGKVESQSGNGVYSSFVKLDAEKPFTLINPDTNTTYGGSGEVLAENGAAIVPGLSGWHKVTVDVNELKYMMEQFRIGLVGSATPNDWNAPDQKMDYDPSTGAWTITLTLKDGAIKFRMNDGWDWNLGGTTDNLTHGGADIMVTAGNYTINLTITDATTGTEKGTYTIVKNN